MSESENVALIRQWYSTLDRSLMAPDVVWNITEGFPHGGIYQGHDAVFGEFFSRLQADFSRWGLTIDDVIDAGDIVVGLGTYQAQGRDTGIDVNVPFAHIWKIQNGKIIALRQYADTLLLHRALSGGPQAAVRHEPP